MKLIKNNNRYTEFKKEDIQQTIVKRFEYQVKINPLKTAVKSNIREVTYNELNKIALFSSMSPSIIFVS